MSVAPECLTCGVCCFSLLENYVRVSGDDHARLAERGDELARFDGNRAYRRMRDGDCASVRIEKQPRQLVCSIDDARPAVCRELPRRSSACRGEVATKG